MLKKSERTTPICYLYSFREFWGCLFSQKIWSSQVFWTKKTTHQLELNQRTPKDQQIPNDEKNFPAFQLIKVGCPFFRFLRSMAVTAREGWFTCCHPWKKWNNKTKVLKNIPDFRKVILNVSYQRIGDGYLKMIIYHILVSKFGSRGVFLHHPLEFKKRPNWNSVL